MQNLYDDLKSVLGQEPRFISEGKLLKNIIVEMSMKMDAELIKLLLSDKEIRRHFFADIDGTLVFDKIKFQRFVMNKRFLPDSYTAYKNKIGLNSDDKYLTGGKEVVLSWPYKDCILEGGQTKEDTKRNEVFWNETLAPDQINQLLAPKVLTNFRKYDENGDHKATNISPNDNLIIKGNNLLALHTIKKRFAGEIKLIYIDPPYNTGGDSFLYNDKFNHSTWLTFMKNRLEVARELLCNDGVIFVQCDDNEQAYLKVLMDEVFGRENFVACFIWKKKNGGGNDSKHVVIEHESIIAFSKDKETLDAWYEKHNKEYLKRYKEVDEKGKFFWDTFARPGLKGKLNYDIEAPDKTKINGDWVWSKKRFLTDKAQGEIKFERNSDNRWTVFFKQRLNEQGKKTRSLMLDKGNSSVGTTEISNMFGDRVFSTPKPEILMQHLIYIATKTGDIVLDYHLGSGTTAAVAHKMGRQYVGVDQMDYIETIAVKRLKKVIAGEQGGISETVGWQGGGSFVYCELCQSNQNFTDAVKSAKTTKKLDALWNDMRERAFLSYKIDPKKINSDSKDFQELSLDDKKRFLIETLNKNMLYVPYSEINDKTQGITKDDKNLNRQFYGNTGE